ncbi:MAG: ABC transporter permease [Atribacterota bacterium]
MKEDILSVPTVKPPFLVRLKRGVRKNPEYILSPLILILLLLFTEYLFKYLNVPTWIIPRPSIILKALVKNFIIIYLPEVKLTLIELLVGYALGVVFGIALAAIISQYHVLEKIVSPYILLIAVTPMIVLVPLLILWLGFSISVRIIVVFVASFPPVMMNSITGYSNVGELRLDLMKSLGASQWQTFSKVKFLSGLPTTFTGVTLAAIISLITVVGAEFLGGSFGLGYLIIYYSSLLQTPMVFGAIVILVIVGISFYLGISWLKNRIVRWTE